MKSYASYIVRIWRTEPATLGGWACSVEDVQEQRQTTFTSVEAMLAHLKQVLAEALSSQPAATRDPPGLQ